MSLNLSIWTTLLLFCISFSICSQQEYYEEEERPLIKAQQSVNTDESLESDDTSDGSTLASLILVVVLILALFGLIYVFNRKVDLNALKADQYYKDLECCPRIRASEFGKNVKRGVDTIRDTVFKHKSDSTEKYESLPQTDSSPEMESTFADESSKSGTKESLKIVKQKDSDQQKEEERESDDETTTSDDKTTRKQKNIDFNIMDSKPPKTSFEF